VRAFVESRPIYLVPRADGELVLGATQYEAGFDTAVTAGGVRDLLVYGERVLPAIAEYELTETAAGLRAGSRDNLPLVGRLEPGVLVAAGHHRNGLLLAPITADAIRAMAAGAEPPAEIKAADPARLER
jgi:glycine oxidase